MLRSFSLKLRTEFMLLKNVRDIPNNLFIISQQLFEMLSFVWYYEQNDSFLYTFSIFFLHSSIQRNFSFNPLSTSNNFSTVFAKQVKTYDFILDIKTLKTEL